MSGRRTVSVLFSDVVGSAQLRSTLGDERADQVFGRHHRGQCAVVTGHSGTVVKALGDGLMAVFDSAADAVDAAASLQRATEVSARGDGVELAVRVGVSAGDARREDDDWFGTPVVEASRLCEAARGGGVLVSDLARQLAGPRTAHRFREVAPVTLKGLSEPVVAHELRFRDAESGVEEPAREVASAAMVRLHVVGRFSVERDAVILDETQFGSRKGRLLLKLLAARRGHLVAMDDIIDALWGATAPAKAEANVATLVSRLRGVVGADVIAGGRSGYRLATGSRVSLDIDEAEQLVTEAEHRGASSQPALALTAAHSALEILTSGSALEDEPGADWAIDLSRQVERVLRRARVAAWRASMDLADHRAALGHARAAIDADALDEEAHRAVMLSYHRLGEQGEALRAYEGLRTILLEELGANPGPETETLFSAILRGEEVDDVRITPTSTRAADVDFVGRDRELAELLELWARTTSGVSSCALIVGHGGIGKTRLAAEVADDVRTTGATVLRARCYEAERSLFLQPIIEIIREAMATLTPDVIRRAVGDRVRSLTTLVPELAAITGVEASAEVTSEIERRQTFEAVAQLLTGLARSRPLLVVLDDLHEAGASTVELLHFAMRWDPRAPLLVLATVRTDEADSVNEHLASVAATVAVSGLTDESIRLLAERAGLADRADAIASMTRGHTLFVVEAMRALADAGNTSEASSGHIDVPPSLRDAVTGRVRRCGPEVEEVLRAAVVIGSAFDVTLLGELLGISPEAVIQRTEPARRADIIVESGDGYEFSNDLIREILYETTPKPLRVVRHRRLVTLLDDHPEAAARHAASAGDARLAVTHWCAAADRASSAFANREAEQLLTSAFDVSASLNDEHTTAGILLARGRARLALGDYAAASDDLLAAEQISHIIGATELETEALTERAWTAYHARDIVQAASLSEEAIGRAGAGPRASILVGRVRNARGNLEGSITLLRTVADNTDDAAQRAYALSCLGTALSHSDRYDEAMPVLDEAVIACRRTGVLRGMLNAQMFGSIVLANLGRFHLALTWAEQLLTDADRFDAPYYHPRALNSLALIWRELGELSRANDLAEEALATSSTSDGGVEGEPAANALLALAESALLAGDDAAAFGRLDHIQPLLSDRVGFAWRIKLRRLEIYARTEPAKAEELLISSRTFGSAKYEALALSYLGRSVEALTTAQLTGSGWLVARVAPEPIARQHAERLAADLPADLRTGFLERGLLIRRFQCP